MKQKSFETRYAEVKNKLFEEVVDIEHETRT